MVTVSIVFLAEVANGMVYCTWTEMQLLSPLDKIPRNPLWLYNFTEKESSAAAARVPCGQRVCSGPSSPCSSELCFRERLFNEYLWLAYSK